jgi:hypothetical protein
VIARTPRPVVLAVLLGLVVLGLLLLFATVLPSSDDTDSDRDGPASPASSPGSTAPITLPDALPGEWTAVDVVDPQSDDPDAAATFAKEQKAGVAYVNEVLGEVYPDYPTAFRAYANDDLSAFVTLTVYDAPGGAYAPNGLSSAERVHLARATLELVRVRDAVCQVNWQSVPDTQEFPADAAPLATSCQLSRDGRTFQMGTQRMSVDDTVSLLEQAADAVG